MNAQEAIEIIEGSLEGLEIRIDDYNFLNGKESGCLKEQAEALSIVLESAKLLHEEIVPRYKHYYEDTGMTDPSSFYGIPLEDIGIKEDTNE